MKGIQVRNMAVVAAATALLMAAVAGARQQGDTKPAEKKAETSHHNHGDAGKIPASSQDAQGVYRTIVGEVMDPACFLEAGAKSIGTGHFQCAVNCAKSGQTLAIYCRDEDRIYFIAGELPGKNPNDPVMQYIHKKVDVSGNVYHRSDAWGIVIIKVALHEDKPGGSGKAASPAGK